MSTTKKRKPATRPRTYAYANGVRIPMRAFKRQKRREFMQLCEAFDVFFRGSAYIRSPQEHISIDGIRRTLEATQAQLRRWWKGA